MKNIKRLRKSIHSLNKAEKKLMKARAKRIWIQNNPHIHILNYPFFLLKYWLTKWFFIRPLFWKKEIKTDKQNNTIISYKWRY